MMELSTPHGDKLRALLVNQKLHPSDSERIHQALEAYQEWLNALAAVEGTFEQILDGMVTLLNNYRLYLDLDIIFDSEQDFLYRQKGQLKLDNTVLEEFVPWLVTKTISNYVQEEFYFGPANCITGLRFGSTIRTPLQGGGMVPRVKNQDFVIGKPLFLKASHHQDFQHALTFQTYIAYVAAECKTNLDKTMFQEASATALDLKIAVPSSKYFLLCEWLDMTPISTTATAIDLIVILRKAKRLSSNLRAEFSTFSGRQRYRSDFAEHLYANPFSPQAFQIFLQQILRLFASDQLDEEEVLSRGYF